MNIYNSNMNLSLIIKKFDLFPQSHYTAKTWPVHSQLVPLKQWIYSVPVFLEEQK